MARGFEEGEDSSIRRDSPTCTKESLRLTLVTIASKGWRIGSLDIKSAFLQGQKIERDVYLKPPKEAGSDRLLKLNKTVYGLGDASRRWYLRVKDELRALGVQSSTYDETLFFWKHEGKLNGVMAVHVDEFLYCGPKEIELKVITVLKTKCLISKVESETFTHLGWEVKQSEDCITFHQQNYIEEIELLSVDKKKEKNELLADEEFKELRVVVGKLLRVSGQTRPDTSFGTCQLSSSLKSSTVEDQLRANKTIKKLKSDEVKLRFPNIGQVEKAQLVSFSDASLANLKNGGSEGGGIIFIVGENGEYAPLSWNSKKIKRMVKGIIAAETFALLEGSENCFLLGSIIKEMLDVDDFLSIFLIRALTDNQSLCDAVHSTSTIEDK